MKLRRGPIWKRLICCRGRYNGPERFLAYELWRRPVFSARIPLKTLAVLCKSLSQMLHSGVALLKTLEIASRKTGDSRCRQKLAAVREEVQQGTDIAQALRQQGGYFPELMVDMVAVGEQTGRLPEVLDGLADHYENIVKLRRMFLGMVAWPVIQLVAAILIVGLVIYILGTLLGTEGADMLHVPRGMLGGKAAIAWLAICFGSIFAIFAGYFVVANVFRSKRFLDGVLMQVPVLGGCMRSFAIARFSWAFALTQQTGMPITRSLELSFRATNNGAFLGASPGVSELVLTGEELSTALAESRLFPEEYISMVGVAETSGTVPEALERLSPQFQDQARRSLTVLAVAMGWLIWLLVAAFIVTIIFLVVLSYVGMINRAASGHF